jgi:uncharacterized protein (TIGR03663 family)
MNRWLTLGLLLAAALALALRLPRLADRPLHTDESVHAYKFLGLWEGRGYRYDPHEYHGPTLYYATLPLAWLSGARDAVSLSEATLRLTPVVFGLGLIAMLPLLSGGLGRCGVWWAGLLTAVSPAFVYYSRYFIHEVLLVFGTLVLLGGAWRWIETRRWPWMALAGAGLGVMYATKETFVFNLAALGAAAGFTLAWGRWREGALWWPGEKLPARHLLVGIGATLAISIPLFTSFFTHARGPLDSILTYQPWLSRAGGSSPHVHPWTFYLERLFWFQPVKGPLWTEVLVLGLGLAGFGAALANRAAPGGAVGLIRFVGFYAVALTLIYSVIPYKTPWCALGFHHAWILAAGAGAAWLTGLVRAVWLRAAVAMALLAGAAHLGAQAWRAAFPFATDQRNPWVYAHTSPDLLRLVGQVSEIAAARPRAAETVIKVVGRGGDYWPLPWYLRGFRQVGFYSAMPEDPWAPLMIVNSKFDAELDEQSGKKWLIVGLFQHRPNVFFELYVELELWKRYLESRPPPADDEDE